MCKRQKFAFYERILLFNNRTSSIWNQGRADDEKLDSFSTHTLFTCWIYLLDVFVVICMALAKCGGAISKFFVRCTTLLQINSTIFFFRPLEYIHIANFGGTFISFYNFVASARNQPSGIVHKKKLFECTWSSEVELTIFSRPQVRVAIIQ